MVFVLDCQVGNINCFGGLVFLNDTFWIIADKSDFSFLNCIVFVLYLFVLFSYIFRIKIGIVEWFCVNIFSSKAWCSWLCRKTISFHVQKHWYSWSHLLALPLSSIFSYPFLRWLWIHTGLKFLICFVSSGNLIRVLVLTTWASRARTFNEEEKVRKADRRNERSVIVLIDFASYLHMYI